MKTEDAKRYTGLVTELARRVHAAPLAGPVAVTIALYPANESRDLDNCIKVLLDALQGSAYGNDRQVRRIVIERRARDDDPRVEVEITAEDVGEG